MEEGGDGSVAMEEGGDGSVATTHFVLIPLMSQGHIIPTIDLAVLLARRPGVMVTLFTTPVNAARSRSVISAVADAGLPVRFIELTFPCAAVGLPDGIENIDLIASFDNYIKFFAAASLLRGPIEDHLLRVGPPPSCVVFDMCLPWAAEIAGTFGVPRFVFHCQSCFAVSCCHAITRHGLYRTVDDDDKSFLVPGVPWQVETTKAESPGWHEFGDSVSDAESSADGVVLNSFYDLEDIFVASFRKTIDKKVWAIGPLCLSYKGAVDFDETRGNAAVLSKEACFEWLDTKPRSSVVYISFGSLANNELLQLKEIGLGLLSSGLSFIWVIKPEHLGQPEKEWLSEFEKENSKEALIVRGWAPQAAILSHAAVGGFVTHCGWNSTLEAITAGLPVVTWPHFADQFLNEKLLVDVLKVGVSVGSRPTNYAGLAIRKTVIIGREAVENTVRRIMAGDGDERRRMKELSEKANRALKEGGTSHTELTDLIDFVSRRG